MDLTTLDPFALTHNGLVTRRALAAAGISDRQWYRAIERGLLDPLHPNVARLPGSARTSIQRIHAAVLAAGPGAMASHRSAAMLWGMPRPDGEEVDVLLPARTRRADVRGAAVHRPRDLLDLTPSRRHHVPATNILRTLCDLGALDAPAVTGAVGHVVSTGLASPAALLAAVRRHGRRGRPGVPALRASLDEWVLDGKPVDSILEPAMRRLLAAHGLPPAEFHPRIGRYEPDFLITGSPLILECDPRLAPGPLRVRPRPRRGARGAGLRGAALHLPRHRAAASPRGRPDPPQRPAVGTPPSRRLRPTGRDL